MLATTDLMDAGITEASFSGWLFFDDARNRAIAMTGRLMHVFAPGSDSLEIETSIDAKKLHVSNLIGKAISKDGRFVVGVDLNVARRNPGDPGREIIIKRGKTHQYCDAHGYRSIAWRGESYRDLKNSTIGGEA